MSDKRSKLTLSPMLTVTWPGAIPQGRALVAQSQLAGVHLCYTLAGHNRQSRCLQPSSTQWDKPQLRHKQVIQEMTIPMLSRDIT
eukprot:3113815-Amphidinium_carterae.1